MECITEAPTIDAGSIAAAHAWAAGWPAGRPEADRPARRLIGFCLAARAEVLEKVGGFDERFVLGNSEDELCARVVQAGYDPRVADGAVVLHHGSATFQRLAREGLADLQDLLRRNGGLFVPSPAGPGGRAGPERRPAVAATASSPSARHLASTHVYASELVRSSGSTSSA